MGEVLNDPDVFKMLKNQRLVGGRLQTVLVELAAQKAAWAQRSNSLPNDTAKHIEPVCTAVEGKLGLIARHFGWQRGDQRRGNVWRVGHKHVERALVNPRHPFGEVGEIEVDPLRQIEGVAVANRKIIGLRRDVGSRDVDRGALPCQGQRDAAGTGANFENPRGLGHHPQTV